MKPGCKDAMACYNEYVDPSECEKCDYWKKTNMTTKEYNRRAKQRQREKKKNGK
jgi:hypothetical protein